MSTEVLKRLTTLGFIIVPGPLDVAELPAITAAYDAMIASGNAHHGSTSARVGLSANRCFDSILAWPLLSQVARHLVGPHFKLSAFHARARAIGAARSRVR